MITMSKELMQKGLEACLSEAKIPCEDFPRSMSKEMEDFIRVTSSQCDELTCLFGQVYHFIRACKYRINLYQGKSFGGYVNLDQYFKDLGQLNNDMEFMIGSYDGLNFSNILIHANIYSDPKLVKEFIHIIIKQLDLCIVELLVSAKRTMTKISNDDILISSYMRGWISEWTRRKIETEIFYEYIDASTHEKAMQYKHDLESAIDESLKSSD